MLLILNLEVFFTVLKLSIDLTLSLLRLFKRLVKEVNFLFGKSILLIKLRFGIDLLPSNLFALVLGIRYLLSLFLELPFIISLLIVDLEF